MVLQDQWSLFNNMAGLADFNQNIAFSSYQNRFGLKELQTIGAGYVHAFDKFSLGAGFYRFGSELFNEQRIHVGTAHKLDRVSLGFSLDYLQYNISTVDSKGVLVIEVGGIAQLTDQISFGAHVFNLNQANLTQDENVPTVMRAGLLFMLSESILMALETEKDLDFPEVYKIGLEYQMHEFVWIRTGLRTDPFVGSFGVGFRPGQFHADYAFSSHNIMGAMHEVSISYYLTKR